MVIILTHELYSTFLAYCFMCRIMSNLTISTTIYNSMTATTLLKLYMSCRLVQPIELAGRVATSYELPGQLHVHSIIQSQGQLGYASTLT